MSQVTIYTTFFCPFCHRAKALLKKKNVAFTEIDVSDRAARQEMRDRAGGRNTVPQIFIGERHIGGCDELHALEARGGLDPLLAQA
jgi:glutaredoxin 3